MLRSGQVSYEERLAIYDTVTGLLREVPREALDHKLWPHLRQVVATATGEVRTTGIWNVKDGPSFTLHPNGLLVERSLPKALRGENITDLSGPEVAASMAALDTEVAAILPFAVPSIAEWQPVRADYCESRQVGGESEVLRMLDTLAHTVLPYKGLPVRGDHHSVRWPKGAISPKFYSKFLETKRDPRAEGVLRGEMTVRHLGTFRALTGTDRPTLADVLRPECFQKVWDPLRPALGGAALSAQEMGDIALVRELVGFFGTRRAAALIGYCVLFVLAGVETRADMVASDVLEFRTKYRVLADIRAFRAAMRAKGYTNITPEGPEADADMVRTLGRLQLVAA